MRKSGYREIKQLVRGLKIVQILSEPRRHPYRQTLFFGYQPSTQVSYQILTSFLVIPVMYSSGSDLSPDPYLAHSMFCQQLCPHESIWKKTGLRNASLSGRKESVGGIIGRGGYKSSPLFLQRCGLHVLVFGWVSPDRKGALGLVSLIFLGMQHTVKFRRCLMLIQANSSQRKLTESQQWARLGEASFAELLDTILQTEKAFKWRSVMIIYMFYKDNCWQCTRMGWPWERKMDQGQAACFGDYCSQI